MLFCFFFIAAKCLNIGKFVDGLENVEFHMNSTNQEANFFVTKNELFIFYQKIPNLQIKINNGGREIKHISNPYQIPKNSIVKVVTNWTKYSQMSHFLIGFVDAEQCDIIFYSNSENYTFPSEFFYKLNICYYHFAKNSTIKIDENNYSRLVVVKRRHQSATMISNIKNLLLPQINGMVQVHHNKKNILAEEEDYDDIDLVKSGGSSMLGFAIFLNICGILLYFIFGFAFGTTCCDKCCSCSCCCCCKNFWNTFNIQNLDVDDRKNDFFDYTLDELLAYDRKVDNSTDE